MSVNLDVKAYSSKESKDFQKHYNAVKFCIENELSFPKETSEFFKGKIGGGDLEDVRSEYILQCIENGVEVDIPFNKHSFQEIQIKVADIPKSADLIVIKLA